ncbi:hypothetical protein [Aeromonas caviae]|uniref:hypothetical protein n=1 Tax=Aeromonas caviae TaxID=648 RepID=UPI002B2536AF|nr:hypothetical protein [Aeromonas caviae]MEA9434098.1 hypothetical protein [Aeromonas caviae]
MGYELRYEDKYWGIYEKMPTVHLPTPIYMALENNGLDYFTITECLKAGYGKEHTSYNNVSGYSFTYTQLMKLVDQGLLSRCSGGRNSKFVKTDKYHHATIDIVSTKANENKSSQRNPITQLNERHGDYESKMQLLLGERREYDDLISMHPQLEGIISAFSNQVYEEIHATLGRIKAVKVIINAVTTYTDN